MRVEAPGRIVFFLTEFQINGMLEALRSDMVDRMSSFKLMEGTVSGDSLGNYRLALSVELSEEEGDCQGHSTQFSQRDKCLFCGQTSPTSHCQ